MLTGARLGEVSTATFDQFNLDLAIWTKQSAYTKQRRVHRVPISHEAVALIRLRKRAVPEGCPFLFPGDVPDQPVGDGADCAFDSVAVDLHAAIGKEAAKAVAGFGDIGECLAQGRFGGGAGAVVG